MTAIETVIRSATSVARDAAEGRLDPAALDAAVADQCRELFGVVAGPGDPLWSLHVDIARQVLALGALTADELGEWQAVIRRREPVTEGSEAVEPAAAAKLSDLPDTPADNQSSASGPHSPDSGYSDADREADR